MHLVDREVVEDRPIEVDYSLTEVGAPPETIVDDFVDWKHGYLTYLEEVAADSEADGGEDDPDRGVATGTDR
jgi:DNA-binding HxlR family transcriptional regulator